MTFYIVLGSPEQVPSMLTVRTPLRQPGLSTPGAGEHVPGVQPAGVQAGGEDHRLPRGPQGQSRTQ